MNDHGTNNDDLEEMDLKWNMALLSMRARKFYQRTGRKIIIDGSSTAGYDKSKVECNVCYRWCGFDWSDMAEDEIHAQMALMEFTDSEVSNDKSCLQNYEALKKQYDDLLVKLDDTGFKAATYKRGLSILEAQVVKYKESEVLFSEEIALLKRSVGHKEYLMGLLKTELEKVKEEKEGFEFKIAKFEKSSKDLDQLLASQITDKSKKGFGYNAVPSPHPLILNRPTPLDLSYSGLEEFKQPEVNEYSSRDSSLKPTTVCDRESDNSKENTDDSLKQQHKTVTETSSVKSSLKVDKDWKEKFFYPANHVREEEPKKARENNDAPIIEDWVSDDEEEVEPIPKVEKKTAIPTATKKESVKPEKPIRRSIRYAEMYRSQGPRGNQRNWNGQKSNVECFNCHKMGHFARECRAPRSKDNRNWNQGSSSKAVRIEDASEKAMCAIDGAGFDWSDMAEDEIQANMALMAFTDSEVSNDKSCSKSCLQNYEALKKQYDDLLVKLDDTGFKAATYKRGLSILEAQVVKYKESEVLFSEEIALLKRSVGHKEYLMGLLKTELEKVKEEKEGFEFKIAMFEKSSKDLDQLLASQITDKSKKGFGYNVVPSPHPLILNRPTPLDLSYSGLEEFKQPEVNEYSSRDSSLKPTTVCDRESDNSKENTDDSLKQQHKTVTETSSVKEEEPKKARENTDAPIIEDWVSDDEEEVKPIPTATKKESVKPEKPIRRSSSCPNAYKHMVPRSVLMKTGLKTVNNAKPVNAVRSVNTSRPFSSASGCSRHKSGNIAHLLDFKDFNGGYVTFVGGANGGRIIGKGTIKTDKLDFEDVYFVKEMKFKVFSVSQMCDKKNYVLFTDSECLVLSPNFKLPDENQILLKIPRQNNMYSFDMKNIVPKDGLTYLVAKATSEESMLWHRRLGHVNFKNINKLVKENLVFFLRTKDETSEIHKNFIKEIENLVDKKVKIIRSDNGTEFKNKVMDEFCREKGIKREYSVARTPQQNGVAERKNRTLIEAARTMLADSKLPTTFWAEAVSTACYVQNRVLIVKPHNKTPYELFRGIKPAIGFMKPFGCHVTILNTLDKLGKFDGKSNEENKPILEGNGPKWLFDLDSLTQSMNYVPVVAGTFSNDSAGIQGVSESSKSFQQDQDCIVMPIWKDASYFDDASLKSVDDAQIQDQDGTHDDCSLQNNGTADQQVNTASPKVNTGSREVSTAVPEVNTATPEDLMGPIPTSKDTQVEDQEIKLGNI
ncbi:ribonuclease H-like domain-containing protein [Tanacetum coccineum]